MRASLETLKPADSLATALACAAAALDKKAYDLVVLDVHELTSVANYFVLCTGRSDTQVQAIAQSVEDNLRRAGEKPIGVEGLPQAHWVLIDFADVIVHIFYEPQRTFFDLDRLFAKAPRVELPEPYASQARDLRLAQEAR